MPLLKIQTNIKIDRVNELTLAASKKVAEILGKPESYVMIHLMPEQNLIFAGSNEAAALLELKSLGLPETRTADLSDALCDFINTQLNIDNNRIYIEFSNPDRHMWGWDNATF